MSLASTWADLVVGVDIHTHLVPTPAGLVPTPLPQLHLGIIGNPAGEAVSAVTGVLTSIAMGQAPSLPTGAVFINNVPATTTRSGSSNLPLLPHTPIPPGVAHAKPPTGQASFMLGAHKITFGGSSAITLGDIGVSCSDPVKMPTSRVVTIPKGPSVLVRGQLGWNVARAAVSWVMGRALRTVWRGSSARVQELARLSGPRLRNLTSKLLCTSTGHPVDVATGRVFTDAVDLALPGPVPLRFERSYFSSWAHRDGPLGRGWSHSLDLALWFEDDLTVFRNGEGQEIVFDRRPAAANDEVFHAPSGNALARDRDGWKVTTAAGLVHRFAAAGQLLRVVRTSGRNPARGLSYRYDRAGRLCEVVDAGGHVVRLQHDGTGRLARLLAPDPARAGEQVPVAEYAYASDGMLVEARDALGRATRYEYDGGALLVQEIDRNGVAFHFMYDGRGSGARCVRTWGRAGDEVIYNHRIDYDPAARVTLVSDSYDNKTAYKMDALGSVVEVVDALGGTTRRGYDEALRLVHEIDPQGNATAYRYGARGQLAEIAHADGARVTMEHDPRWPELVTARVDEAGATWRYRYDDAGQLLEALGPEPDAWTRYEWREGLPAATMDAGGARTEVIARDGQGNATVVRLPNGAEVRREHDRRGRCVAELNPYGGLRTFTWDAADRLVATGEPDGGRVEVRRDATGNPVEIVHRQRRIRLGYGNFNRLVSREDGDGGVVRFTWGLEGELREVRNAAGESHRLTYDPCLRVEREVGFDGREIRYRRSAAGWVTRIDRSGDPRARIEQAHDARGRVVEIRHGDGSWARFGYRGDGALVEAANPALTVRFQRDGLGRVVRETQGDVEVLSTYAAGGRATLRSSLGAALAVKRDALGNPTALIGGAREPICRFEHDAAGRELERVLPGAVVARWRRDLAGRPVRHEVDDPDGGFTRDYRWGADGRIAEIVDSRSGAARYQHDPCGRLIAEHHGGTARQRGFDAAGNVFRTATRTDRDYGPGGVLRRDRDTVFAFDARGNMIERSEPGAPAGACWRYHWDGSGMLGRVTGPDGAELVFSYDALGRRVGKRSAEGETRFVWDGDVVLHELRSDRPPVTWYHLPDSFTPAVEVSRSGVRAVVSDHLGTPIAAYDANGIRAWQLRLDLFGAGQHDGAGFPLRWPGHYQDRETGLHYSRFRYYDPELGCFISPDPIGLEGGLALYAYPTDPLSEIDPLGLTPCAAPSWKAAAGRLPGVRVPPASGPRAAGPTLLADLLDRLAADP
jgi:RHS repeat-associated protein